MASTCVHPVWWNDTTLLSLFQR